MRKIVVVAHNIRSAHNVGSLLRTADGLGVEKIYLSGYTPYPPTRADNRLPHIATRAGRQIEKTALGAENTINWEHAKDVMALLEKLKSNGYSLVALEQSAAAVDLAGFKVPGDLALILGSEIGGVDTELLEKMDEQINIPMAGRKDSFNVSVAAAIAIYHLRNFA